MLEEGEMFFSTPGLAKEHFPLNLSQNKSFMMDLEKL